MTLSIQDHFADPILDNLPSREIDIDNRSNSSELTDYQIDIDVSNHVDKQEMRFVDENLQIVDYWEEDSDTIWVEIPKIVGNKMSAIRMMRGDVDSASDGDATFEFFDDFEYDDDPANHGWTIEHGTYNSNYNTVTDYAKRGSRSLKIYPASGQIVSLYRALSSNNRYACEVDYYETDPTELSIHTFLHIDDVDERLACYDSDKYRVRYNSNWYTTSTSRSLGWHKLGILRDGTSVYFMVDGTEADSYANSNNITNSGLYSGSGNSGWDSTRYWDSFRVRKYTSPEPTAVIA